MRKNSFSKFLAIGTAQIGSKYGINNKNILWQKNPKQPGPTEERKSTWGR